MERLEQDADGIWVATGEEEAVNRSAVQRVVEAEFSQRQQDRGINPHAEHAEDVFTLLSEVPLDQILGKYQDFKR